MAFLYSRGFQYYEIFSEGHKILVTFTEHFRKLWVDNGWTEAKAVEEWKLCTT